MWKYKHMHIHVNGIIKSWYIYCTCIVLAISGLLFVSLAKYFVYKSSLHIGFVRHTVKYWFIASNWMCFVKYF